MSKADDPTEEFRRRKREREEARQRGQWDQDPLGVELAPPPKINTELQSMAEIYSGSVEKTPLIPDLLYPGAWLLVGRPKIGKSWLELQLALAMGTGQQFMQWPILAACDVLYIAAEDDEPRMRSRLHLQSRAKPPPSVSVLLRSHMIALAKSQDESVSLYAWLDGYLAANPETHLVIVDTEMSVLQIWAGEAEGRKSNSVIESDYKRTSGFDEIGQRRNAAIILANHASKRRGHEATQDFHEFINRSNTAFAGASGSIVLADLPDADLHDTKQKQRVLAIRGRDLKDDYLLTIKQDEDAQFSVVGLYSEVKQTEAEKEIMEALEELMIGVEESGYVTTAEISTHMGKQRQAVIRSISRMQKAGRSTWGKYRLSVRAGTKGGCRLDPL